MSVKNMHDDGVSENSDVLIHVTEAMEIVLALERKAAADLSIHKRALV